MIRNSDNETHFPHKLVSTNRQGANLCDGFTNDSSTNIKLSKIQ